MPSTTWPKAAKPTASPPGPPASNAGIVQQDEEVGARGAGAAVRHGDGAGNIVQAGLAGRLVRDRREQLARVAPHAALDEVARGAVHGAVEALAVEPVGVDIMEEVGGGDRRMGAVDGDHDPAEAGVDGDGDEVGLQRGGGRRSAGGLGEERSGKGREQRGGEECAWSWRSA